MMTDAPRLTQLAKAHAFRALHQRDAPLSSQSVGCWNCAGTGTLGFEALATTSMGYAFSGARDNTLDRRETMAYVSAIAASTDLPVSADLENGFGDAPEFVAETIRLASAAG